MNEQFKWKLIISNQELFKNSKGSCGKRNKDNNNNYNDNVV